MIILNFFTEKKYLQLEPTLIKKRILTEVGKIFTRPYREVLKFHIVRSTVENKPFHLFIYPEIECELASLLTKEASFTLTDTSSWRLSRYRWDAFLNHSNYFINTDIRNFDYFKIINNPSRGRSEVLIDGLFEKDISKISSSNIWRNIIFPLTDFRSSLLGITSYWGTPNFNTIFYPFLEDNFESVIIDRMILHLYSIIKHIEEHDGETESQKLIRTFIEKNNISIESFKKKDMFSKILMDKFRGNVNILYLDKNNL